MKLALHPGVLNIHASSRVGAKGKVQGKRSTLKSTGTVHLPAEWLESIRAGANESKPVGGLTHQFYRYPARFSPEFAAKVIETCSSPGDVVLDPYMGGGTTIVEASARKRRAIGCDINSLAVFVSQAKTTPLSRADVRAVEAWADRVQGLSYHDSSVPLHHICPERTKNLTVPRARAIKKFLAQALAASADLPNRASQRFVRCALLGVAQWALNSRQTPATLEQTRERVRSIVAEMLTGMFAYASMLSSARNIRPVLHHGSAEQLAAYTPFASGVRADLVVTSPPYPGVHILYHRWQVDGRKETPAPYWIADCLDGEFESYYSFGGRNAATTGKYFSHALTTLRSIRSCLRDGALMVQMLAFSEPRTQLPHYLRTMQSAGFTEIRHVTSGRTSRRFHRIWREIPGRAWHASQKGDLHSSREIVLIHRAS